MNPTFSEQVQRVYLLEGLRDLKTEKDAEITQLKARADKAEAESATLRAESASLKAQADKVAAESMQLKAFLCGQFPNAPMCKP